MIKKKITKFGFILWRIGALVEKSEYSRKLRILHPIGFLLFIFIVIATMSISLFTDDNLLEIKRSKAFCWW